jgi:transposase
MVRPDFAKWGQSPEEMRRLAIEADHPRSRERFHSLYMIGSGQKSATQWATETQRQPRTVLNWVHLYNEQGPDGLFYQASGGRSPFLANRSKSA